jgi:cbb3-type cytochrome oxidase cytochrome c subunit
MPIPTDTFWNIKLLNRVFAVSALALLGVTAWSILQDYNKTWRQPQDQGRVWEAALVDQKIERALTPNQKVKLTDLTRLVNELDVAVKSGKVDHSYFANEVGKIEAKHKDLQVLTADESEDLAAIRKLVTDPAQQVQLKKYSGLTATIVALESQISTQTFKLDNLKSNVTVAESNIQDARAEGKLALAKELEEKLSGPRQVMNDQTEAIAKLKKELKESRKDRLEVTKAIDDLRRLAKKLGEEVTLFKKKLSSLRPDTVLAKVSSEMRRAPLAQFMNPEDGVKQVVLPDIRMDVSFMKIDTVDRCTTCHVHIDNKDFTEARVLGYLEEQLASGRKVRFSAVQKYDDPTADEPGATAMPEFWIGWAVKLAPGLVQKNVARIDAVLATVGEDKAHDVIVTYQGKAQGKLKYNPAADESTAARQSAILVRVIDALYRFDKPLDVKQAVATKSDGAGVAVEIPAGFDAGKAAAARNAAFTLPIELRKGLMLQLGAEAQKLLGARYRAALAEQVNVFRKAKGYAALDSSVAMLAHPRLDLYVDADSPHKMDLVGCTSCHDGSGQESDFVLAAHSARKIWVDNRTGLPVLPEQILAESASAHGHEGPDMADLRATALAGKVGSLHFDLTAKPAEHEAVHPATKPTHSTHALEATAESAGVTYIDPITGETRKAVSQIQYWTAKYEAESGTHFATVYHEWDWPMRTPEFIQANCARCHNHIHDIKDEAPVLYEGRALFAKLGCVNCHQMDSVEADDSSEPNGKRRVGPDLRHVKSKLSDAFLDSWIWAPKAFRPSTMMPHFFMLENNSSDEELRRTQQEVRAIRAYLTKTSTPAGETEFLRQPENKMPAAEQDQAKVDEAVARGRGIFVGLEASDTGVAGIVEKQGGVGCMGCHTNLNETGRKWIIDDMVKGDGLADFKDEFTAKTIAAKKKAPTLKEIDPEARKEAAKRYRAMTYNERQIYATEHFGEALGSTTIPKYPDGSPKPVFQHHGPELSGVGTKLLAGGRSKAEVRQWLYNWLMEPRHYSSYTVMPRLRLSPQEASDLAEYLLAQRRKQNEDGDDPWKATEIKVDQAKVNELVARFLLSQASAKDAQAMAVDDFEMTRMAGIALKNNNNDAETAKKMAEQMPLQEKQLVFLGQKLIGFYGCMSCHAINGMENATSPCANLSDWGQKGVDKLDFGYLTHHKIPELPPTAKIPMVNGLSPAAVTTIPSQLNGRKFGEPIAQEVSVSWPHIDHTRVSWLEHKLTNTRVYDRGKNLLEPVRQVREGKAVLDQDGNPVLKADATGKPYDKLRMPTFYLNEEQVQALVTFVVSNRDKLISEKLLAKVNNEQALRIAKGRQIVEKYNCVGCHRVEGNQPGVQQYWLQGYFDKSDIASKAPPSLRGQGSRVQHAWLFNFLKQVEKEGTGPLGKIRPLPFIRMPSFPIQDDEASAVAAYFSAVAVQESHKLAKKLDPLLKEAAKAQGPTTMPTEAAEIWPEEDWHKQAKYADLAGYLKEWALDNTPAVPLNFDPKSPKDLARAYQTALYDARFVRDLYDAPYPFADLPRPTPDEARFKKGEAFYHVLQCHSCHVLGNESADGVNKTAKGPNLNLVQRRLQRRWARQWVQETQIIQTGSIMVPYFSGRAVPSVLDADRLMYQLHGLPYLGSPASAEATKQGQFNFGQTADEQADLLLDFIYAAALRGYTSIDTPQGEPKLAPTPASFKAAPIPGMTAPFPERRAPKTVTPKIEVVAAPVATALSGPSIMGKIVLQGAAPTLPAVDMKGVAQCANCWPGGVMANDTLIVSKSGEVRDVIVSVSEGLPAGPYAIPGTPALLDQKGCHYEPHILPMMVGQPIVIRNSDPFLHNVHGLPTVNGGFNFGQTNIDAGKPVEPMKAAEKFRVKCDVHPWMNSQFVVFEHPFFAATGADGSFVISGLPPGTYTITTWHERCQTETRQVKIEAGKPAQADFSLKYGKPEE